MIKIVFDTNIINVLENVDREGRNKPDIKEYTALINMINYRRNGKCKIFSSIYVHGEILDTNEKNRADVRRNLILLLLDNVRNPKLMYRKPNPDKLVEIFGRKDGAIVFECIVQQIDYLITRDKAFVNKARNNLKYRKPKVLKPEEANNVFMRTLPGYKNYFDYL